jgi:hypothetical protein
VVDDVALTPQQYVESPIAKPTAFPGQLAEPKTKRLVIMDPSLIPDGGRLDPNKPASTPLRDGKALL